MSGVPYSKLVWERETDTDASAMESCVKLYTWINHTVLMLLFQIFWKVSQISDFFKGKSIEESKSDLPFSPLTRASKVRRHIRSMSDVQCSTPYRLPFRSKNNHVLTYDSDTRARRIRAYNPQQSASSDSDSDSYFEARKERCIKHNILKHTDSMRIL